MKRLSGVYMIRNRINGKMYIGSAVDLRVRWSLHKWELRHHKHNNPYFQNAWDKSGEQNFEFKVLEEVDPVNEKLIEREQYYLDLFKSYLPENGYNIRTVVDRNLGLHHSKESKRKIGLGNKGKFVSEETRKKQSEAIKGFKHSEEAKRKMKGRIPWNKGKHLLEETKQKIRLANLGKKKSETVKQLWSIQRKGKQIGKENPFYGRKHSIETVNRIKATLKKYWEQKRNT
jgi:hypothetical protein